MNDAPAAPSRLKAAAIFAGVGGAIYMAYYQIRTSQEHAKKIEKHIAAEKRAKKTNVDKAKRGRVE